MAKKRNGIIFENGGMTAKEVIQKISSDVEAFIEAQRLCNEDAKLFRLSVETQFKEVWKSFKWVIIIGLALLLLTKIDFKTMIDIILKII
jgi:hypothetical protein